MRLLILLWLGCVGFNLHAVTQPNKCLVLTAQSKLGLKETPGRNNRGPELDALVLSVRGQLGRPWCGYFMMWTHHKCQCSMAGGMAMSWFVQTRLVQKASLTYGDLFSIWNPYLKRIGHVGLVESVMPSGNVIVTLEGNTNATGNREGSGVFRLTRPVKGVYNFSRWWK